MIMETTNKRELVISRIFSAPIGRVWKMWSNPERFATWYGAPGELIDVEVDFRVGGTWRATTVMPNGDRYPQMGIYQVIREPDYLEFSFPLDVANSENSPTETMSISLKDIDGKRTEMLFKQTGTMEPDVYVHDLKKGWTGFFDAMAESLDTKTTNSVSA
jgi:uncharacterized protein YndB with AHSA1/START domain